MVKTNLIAPLFVGISLVIFEVTRFAFAAEGGGSGIGGGGTTGSGAGGAGTTGSGVGVSFSGSGSLQNPLQNITSITGFFLAILDILLVFAIPFVVFFIIYAGFMYVTARGNSSKIATAHNALLYAIIGGLLILGARLILNIIEGTVSEFISLVPLFVG